MKQNFAFISYNHKDVKWAKWLRRKLEWYRLPSEIHNEFDDSRYLRPIFRDRDELDSGVLGDELRKHLENSKYLIVICSPNSATSEWVSNEVQAFIDMGRLEYIIPFVVEGAPQTYSNADAVKSALMGECFPYALRLWNLQHPQDAPLGIAVTDDGGRDKQKAFIRVVSRMLDVSFDTLWQRHKREIRAWVTLASAVAAILLSLAYWFMVPVRLAVTLTDEVSALPGMEHGRLTVDGSEYAVTSLDTTIEVGNLPGYYRMTDIAISFKADRYYAEEMTTMQVTPGLRQTVTIPLHRDSTFAVFAGNVVNVGSDYSLSPLSGAKVTIDQETTTTDQQGHFEIVFPTRKQSLTKHIEIQKEGFQTLEREDEVPSDSLKYVMMPSSR